MGRGGDSRCATSLRRAARSWRRSSQPLSSEKGGVQASAAQPAGSLGRGVGDAVRVVGPLGRSGVAPCSCGPEGLALWRKGGGETSGRGPLCKTCSPAMAALAGCGVHLGGEGPFRLKGTNSSSGSGQPAFHMSRRALRAKQDGKLSRQCGNFLAQWMG